MKCSKVSEGEGLWDHHLIANLQKSMSVKEFFKWSISDTLMTKLDGLLICVPVCYIWQCYNVLLAFMETRVVAVFTLDSDDVSASAGLACCCCCRVNEVCTSPGVDNWDEVAEFGSAVWSAVPLPSTMLGQPDTAGDVFNRSLSALIASSLHKWQQNEH